MEASRAGRSERLLVGARKRTHGAPVHVPLASAPPHGVRMADAAATPRVTIVPANEATCEDHQAVFGTRGAAATCQCQRYKLPPRESFASFPAEERAFRLCTQTDCGHPESETTSGLVAYLDGERVGWCAVEPRTAYPGLVRVYRVPWDGRSEDKSRDARRLLGGETPPELLPVVAFDRVGDCEPRKAP